MATQNSSFPSKQHFFLWLVLPLFLPKVDNFFSTKKVRTWCSKLGVGSLSQSWSWPWYTPSHHKSWKSLCGCLTVTKSWIRARCGAHCLGAVRGLLSGAGCRLVPGWRVQRLSPPVTLPAPGVRTAVPAAPVSPHRDPAAGAEQTPNSSVVDSGFQNPRMFFYAVYCSQRDA